MRRRRVDGKDIWSKFTSIPAVQSPVFPLNASSRYHHKYMVPQPLQHSSSRVLEFDHFRDVLGFYVSSPLGKARIAQLEPSLDRAWINRQQQLADETRRFYSAGGRF